ncbi:MAG TPA: stage II sporulation protein R [Bacilli bacterium]|nr:stage II sporulation protein R [Bacilli bacterium]
MSRKGLIYLLIAFFTMMMSWEYQQEQAVAALHKDVPKEEAIRLRILANSDSIQDQLLKRSIRDAVNHEMTEWVSDIDDIEEAKLAIANRVDSIEDIVADELAKLGQDQSFTVTFAPVQFPTKLYGDLVYPAGTYDAVLITLGAGKGENWWCVLFPPLCFLDFDHSEVDGGNDMANNDNEEEVEVRFFFVDIFNKLTLWIGQLFTT